MIIPVPAEQIADMSRDDLIAAYAEYGIERETAEAYADMLKPEPEPVDKSIIVSVAHARKVADRLGNPEFSKAVAAAEERELSEVTVSKAEDGSLVLGQPDGVMVGWFVPEWQAEGFEVVGGVNAHHITFAYLGLAANLTTEEQRTVIGVAAEVSARHNGMRGILGGTEVFETPGARAWVARASVPGLEALQADLVQSLSAAGLPVSKRHDFTPHMTLAYLEDGQDPPAVEFTPTTIWIDRMTVSIAGLHFTLQLLDTDSALYELPSDTAPHTPYRPMLKSIEEKRYTLAPVYIPNRKDAHGDWATSEDLQEALWEFSRGDKHIAVQHDRKTYGGEVVELMTIPWEHEVEMPNDDGTFRKETFPAGTPWMGVVWDENAWPLVKMGKIRGYSIGGRAIMVNEEPPEA